MFREQRVVAICIASQNAHHRIVTGSRHVAEHDEGVAPHEGGCVTDRDDQCVERGLADFDEDRNHRATGKTRLVVETENKGFEGEGAGRREGIAGRSDNPWSSIEKGLDQLETGVA